ncbi:hypothetical protein DFH09DRAFT_1073639 [Mycena vulgaris]|nr:hypothetical protein DFH09DRAFT_1073639 [Mycena vulgaris]
MPVWRKWITTALPGGANVDLPEMIIPAVKLNNKTATSIGYKKPKNKAVYALLVTDLLSDKVGYNLIKPEDRGPQIWGGRRSFNAALCRLATRSQPVYYTPQWVPNDANTDDTWKICDYRKSLSKVEWVATVDQLVIKFKKDDSTRTGLTLLPDPVKILLEFGRMPCHATSAGICSDDQFSGALVAINHKTDLPQGMILQYLQKQAQGSGRVLTLTLGSPERTHAMAVLNEAEQLNARLVTNVKIVKKKSKPDPLPPFRSIKHFQQQLRSHLDRWGRVQASATAAIFASMVWERSRETIRVLWYQKGQYMKIAPEVEANE